MKTLKQISKIIAKLGLPRLDITGVNDDDPRLRVVDIKFGVIPDEDRDTCYIIRGGNWTRSYMSTATLWIRVMDIHDMYDYDMDELPQDTHEWELWDTPLTYADLPAGGMWAALCPDIGDWRVGTTADYPYGRYDTLYAVGRKVEVAQVNVTYIAAELDTDAPATAGIVRALKEQTVTPETYARVGVSSIRIPKADAFRNEDFVEQINHITNACFCLK